MEVTAQDWMQGGTQYAHNQELNAATEPIIIDNYQNTIRIRTGGIMKQLMC